MERAFHQEAALSCPAAVYPNAWSSPLFSTYTFQRTQWIQVFGCASLESRCAVHSLATFRPLGCRQRVRYENSKIWSHVSKQWDWEFFIALCSKSFVGVTTVCQSRAWADVISQLVPVSLDSKPRQMGMQWFPHLGGPQGLEVCCRMHLRFSEEAREN